MLVHKRTRRLRVTLRADGILIGARLKQLGLECAVRIVAVSAIDQPFIHAMMKREIKCGFCICMALIADLRLLGFQQFRLRVKMMDAVAARAAYACRAMGRPLKVWMVADVTRQAFLVDLLWRCLRELKNLGWLSTAINMSLTGTVTVLAGHALGAMLQS